MRRALGIGLATLLAIACSEDETPSAGVLLVLDTDMTVPDAVAEVGLYVEHVHAGQRRLVVAQEAKPLYNEATKTYDVKFAATFTVQAGLEVDASDRIRTRFIAFGRDGAVLGMREARTAVPSKEFRQLRLPVLFVNQGTISDSKATLSVRSSQVGLRQAQPGGDNDPFTRFRQEGCGEEQTRGDDGQCVSIDIPLESLPEGTALEPIPACLDVPSCFGGDGVRDFDLSADCTFTLPAGSTNVAIALHDEHGYPVGTTAGAAKLQPVDKTLYTQNGSSVRLVPALCERAKAAKISRVAASPKCAPKEPKAPICADWRSETAQPFGADGDAGFVTQVEDSGVDVVDASDAGDTDADSEPPPRVAFEREIALPAAVPLDRMASFAARNDGMAWLMLASWNGGPYVGRTKLPGNDDDAELDRILGGPNESPSNIGALELGANSTLYYLPGESSQLKPKVLVDPRTSFDEVKLGASCSASLDPDGFFTIGTHAGETVAAYGGFANASSQTCALSFDRSKPGSPECFTNETEVLDAGSPGVVMGRGSTFGGAFRIPVSYVDTLLGYAPPRVPATLPTPFGPVSDDQDNYVTPQSLLALDDTRAVLIGKTMVDGETPFAHFFHVKLTSGEPVLGPSFFPPVPGAPTREVFGARGVVCARLVESWGDLASITCMRYDGVNAVRFALANVEGYSDLHVYGDDDYMYLAKTCWNDAASVYDRVKLTATPWDQVSGTSASRVYVGCDDHIPAG